MEEDEQEQRRRKVEAGRAKLAHFRQRKTKGDCAHSKKKTAKRKDSTVDAPVQEASPVATKDGGLLGGGDVCKNTSSDTPDGARGAFVVQTLFLGNESLSPAHTQGEEHEQERELVTAELVSRHNDETGWLLQTQTVHSLELEALRLSLSNMHTAQLELTQANLQKEKETALTELREMLNSRRAQELALLQSRQQYELELIREQHAHEKEEMVLRCGQETAKLKEKLQSEMEKNAQIVENLKQDWESERDLCLENLRKELSAKHQSEMENLQNQFQKESAEQKAELEKIFQAKNEAELTLKNLETRHEAAIKKLREDLQAEHCQYLEDLELKFREKEKKKQLELENLQASYEDLKAQSQEEIRHLWSQLDSTRTNRQELNELQKQLLPQASHVEELEHVKQDFVQQSQRERTEHESELEQLRIYFEKKRDAEKTYQEDLTLLQQRLQEVKEDSLLKSEKISSSCTFSEETSEKEVKHHLDQLDLRLEQPKMELAENHRHKLEVLTSSLHVQHEEHASDSRPSGTMVWDQEPKWELEWLWAALSEKHSQELAQVRLQCAKDAALEIDKEVAARILGLETEHKVKLSLFQTELKEEIELLRIENRSLHEKLHHEIRLKEDLEKVKHNLVKDHQEELNKAEEKIQLMKRELKEKEAEWKVASEDLERESEEKLTLMLLELREKAESEKQSIINKFELRETEMRLLEDQQAAQILDLERSLMEQQGRLWQLEHGLAGDEVLPFSPGDQEPPEAQDGEHGTLRVKEDCALQLMLARNRFLEERKEITKRFNVEQDAFLREAQEKHARELQLLQERHQKQLLSLTTELETRHQTELSKLAASLERESWAFLEARVAELQAKHTADVSALESRHLSNLDSLESCYLSEVQTVRDEHRRALELLRADFQEQLQEKDRSHQTTLAQELERLQLKHDEELQSTKESLRTEMSARHVESLKALAIELQGAHQEELAAALRDQRRLLEEERIVAPDRVDADVLLLEHQHQAALQVLGDAHTAEMQKQQAEHAQLRELQAPLEEAAQLKEQVLSLSHEIEACRCELETLQQRRERENQEGANLVSMLKADADLCSSERRALRDALRRLLGLFGETLKAAVTLKSRINERMGLCLDDVGTAGAGQALLAASALDETWSDGTLLDVDRTLPECVETSSVTEISSHLCESFFMSPESTLECEQPIRRVYQSLGIAVDGLLEVALDSTRQLEEARQLHSHFEKEFICKNKETAQVVKKHQELLECLKEESAVKAKLALELHKAEGVVEGFKVEKVDLQEALGRKEESEQQLILELDHLRQQLQQAALEQAAMKEEYSALWSQKEASAVEAKEREAACLVVGSVQSLDPRLGTSALRKEVDSLIEEQSEARKQSEKDRSALLSQMKVLESELEEQLSQHQGCAARAKEISTLRQQMASLDKHLRSQRQFMDEQAAEREHEREEFQQEIRRLEGQLRQAAKPQPWGPCDSQCSQLDAEVESLQEKLREKSDGFNELVIKKELADRQLLIQEEEIKHLEETNVNTRRKVVQLQEELEKQKKIVKELQDKEVLKEQQMSDLLLASTLTSEPDEGKCSVPPEGPEIQAEVAQRALLGCKGEVLDLKEQLEKIKGDLVSKNEEILHLNLKLDVQNSHAAVSIRELEEENANLKVEYSRSSEIEELKAIIENLQENQERLQKDKAEEIEQLHEVIEKLQRELSIMGPVVHEVSDSQAESLQSELLSLQVESPVGQLLQGELDAALMAKESLSQLLADQAQGHSQALEAVQQRLRQAEVAAARQLAELRRSAALREAEVKNMASQIQEFEVALKAKEAMIAERDLEINAMNKRNVAHSAELEAILLALARFRCALEQRPLAAQDEPPELQRLRAQCARLSHQLQVLNQRFLRCQTELDRQQTPRAAAHTPAPRACLQPRVGGITEAWVARVAEAVCEDESEWGVGGRWLTTVPHDLDQDTQDDFQPAKVLVTLKDADLPKQESVMSVLTLCQRQLESELLLMSDEVRWSVGDSSKVSGRRKGKEKLLEDCQLQKDDLIAQVKQLQEKLNHLVYSVTFQDVDTEDFKFQQPLASAYMLENSSSVSSHSNEEPDKSLSVEAFNTDKTTWDLTNIIKNRDSLIINEMPNFPIQEKLALQDGSLSLQNSMYSGFQDPSHTKEAETLKNLSRALDLSSWSSPEVLRKDSTLEPPPSLPLTPCSGTLSLRSANTSLQDRMDPLLLPAGAPELLCHLGESAAMQVLQRTVSPSASHHHVERTAVEKDVEDFMVTSFDPLEASASPGLAGKSEESGKSDGLGFGARLSLGTGGLEAPAASVTAPACISGRFRWSLEAMKGKEVHPKHVKALLQMVCDESRQILALSESCSLPRTLGKGEPHTPLDHLSREGQGLLEAAPQKGEKEASDVCFDWRGEFLQVFQGVFEKEWEMLQVQLQPRLCNSDPGDHSALFKRLGNAIQEQGNLQEKSLEHLHLSDRNSLLSEIQALRAQLRMTHLQNQEKLQQLCAALTSAEAHGSHQEHQLRRQVELLAYKVEQEKCIASDLQKTLSEEQEKALCVRKLLVVEQNAVRDLKSELCECKQENERLLQSLNDVQKEVLQLRSMLDSKEHDLKATLQELESERVKERALQSQLEEKQLQHLQREGQSAKSLEELRISLEKQYAQSSRLCVALKHEQMAKDNLQKELQIESSRCEALLAQERSQLSELQKSLEAEKSRSLELSEALQHERLLTEQLSQRTQEACAHQETQVHRALLRKLKEEKSHVVELQAVLEKVQQQAVRSQQQLEAEAQKRCEELRKEKERELQLQRQRDEHKIKQLQQTVRELESKEQALCGNGPHLGSPHRACSLGLDCLREQQQELERIRQQLLCAARLLTCFINQTVDRTINDWTSSNEKAVTSLLRTLEELKSELSTSTSSQKKMAAELQIQLVDVLLKDNDSLTKAVSTVTREKAELCRALSKLEKTLKHHLQKGCTLSSLDRSARKQDRAVLQSSSQHSDPSLPTPAANEEANTCNVKMEKLYLHYLRAESFRKALIYQKKYLLLLIGGFQDSEQETLSMIAHLGVFPSKADKKISTSRPFTRFRTAVRVVIATLRLRFLVKKWQEVDRKGTLAQGRAPRPGPRAPRQHRSPPETRESPPTRDVPSGHARDPTCHSRPVTTASLRRRGRSTPSPNSRLERSLTASQDPEESLTEYIHHLEMIQQRLGGYNQIPLQRNPDTRRLNNE
ncbi:pericentrin isoform X2 [Cynocephalus volans]|uniref:pericentrin isoform X2 n=1 Tax=Cynocephalus volans TaxID=110931 RepID=UPI002FCBEF59